MIGMRNASVNIVDKRLNPCRTDDLNGRASQYPGHERTVG